MFKNVWVYGVASGWPESLDVLETALQRMAFVPAIASQDKSVGWIAPRGKSSGEAGFEPLAESVNGHWMLRFMAETATISTIFAKRGLIAEHGMSWLLPRLIGLSRALDVLWSSRKIDATEALRLGLVDRVVPDDALIATVQAYVDDLAAHCAPQSLAHIKTQLLRHLQTDFDTAAHEADRLMATVLRHPDATEGAMSFVERRPPRFTPWTGVAGQQEE